MYINNNKFDKKIKIFLPLILTFNILNPKESKITLDNKK